MSKKKTTRISRGPAPKSVSHEQSTIADLCMNNLFRNQIGVLGLSFIHRGTQNIYIYIYIYIFKSEVLKYFTEHRQ